MHIYIRMLCPFFPFIFYHIVQLTLALPLPSKSTERIELPTMWISRTFVDVRVASAVLLVHQHSLRMQQRIYRRSCTPRRMLFAWERNSLAIFVEERMCICAHTFRDPRFVSRSISCILSNNSILFDQGQTTSDTLYTPLSRLKLEIWLC